MELLFQSRDLAVCVKPVGLDCEHELPAALRGELGGETLSFESPSDRATL